MKVLIFNHSFFNISETFVYKQVTGMPGTVEMPLMGFAFINEDKFPVANKKLRVDRFVNRLDRWITSALRRVGRGNTGFSVLNHFLVKRMLQQERPDLIHAHFGFNAVIIYPLARQLNIPLVVTFHGVDASPEYLQRKGYSRAVRQLLEYAAGVIVVSPHMRETLQLKEDPYLIPCCVDPDEFASTARADNAVVRILHSGRLISKKGVPDLIRVCRTLEGVQLDIIGEGPELPLCRQLADGCQHIHFHGARPNEEVKQFMAASDIFVLNSRTGDSGDMEGMPVSILEAMSMKMAVVSTQHAGIPMAIIDGVTGLLVPEKNNAALEEALRRLIKNKNLRTELGTAARKKIEKEFTISQMNQKIMAVYANVNK